MARAIADPIIEAQLTDHLGDTCKAMGDPATARQRWHHAHQILTDAGQPQAADIARKLRRSCARSAEATIVSLVGLLASAGRAVGGSEP